MLTGLTYNLATWADKVLFWGNPSTSENVIGPLRASIIYDIPIFLSYVSSVPGMSVFLVRIESDFVECYDAFYDAVRSGDTLANMERLKDRMVLTMKLGPNFYGYGFASAMLLSCLVGFGLLSSKLDSLEYETFMMQHFS